MIIDDRTWFLISEKLSGEISEADLKELETLLQNNPDSNVRVQLLESIFRASPDQSLPDKKAAFLKHLQRMQQQDHDFLLKMPLPQNLK